MLRPRTFLETRGRPPEHAYFPSGGLLSVLGGPRRRQVEICLIGAEGMTAAPSLLGDQTSLHDVVVQVGEIGRAHV